MRLEFVAPSRIGMFIVVSHFNEKIGIGIGITNGIGASTFEANDKRRWLSTVNIQMLLVFIYED